MAVESHFSDVDLILRDPEGHTKTFPTHKIVLIMNSEFFKALLTGSFRESHNHDHQIAVEVPDLTIAQNLLAWFYTKDPYFPLESLDLAQQWIIPSALVNTRDYPSESGTFTRGEGNWIPGTVQKEHHWIEFKSTTPTSLIQSLKIRAMSPDDMIVGIEFRWRNVRVANGNLDPESYDYMSPLELTAYFDQAAQRIHNYFQIYGLTIKSDMVYRGYYSAHKKNEQHTLLKIILATNTFSDEDHEFLMTLWVT